MCLTQAVKKMKKRARMLFYWVCTNNDIDNYVAQCKIWQKNSYVSQKQPLIHHEVPSFPFERGFADIATFLGNNYLVLADSCSKWIEIFKIRNKSAAEVISILKPVFASYGIPFCFGQ